MEEEAFGADLQFPVPRGVILNLNLGQAPKLESSKASLQTTPPPHLLTTPRQHTRNTD